VRGCFYNATLPQRGDHYVFREEVYIKGATLCSQVCLYTLVLAWACIRVTRGSCTGSRTQVKNATCKYF